VAITETSAQQAPAPERLIGVIGLTLALGYLVVLGGALASGHWLFDAYGQPIANDFVDVFAAGRLALDGHAASAYDWSLHRAAEVRAIGHDFGNYYGWHYPPTYFFVAVPLALLPFSVAAVMWLAATLPLYVVTVRAIVGARAGILLALGFPALLWNTIAGQNGFLTAALIGGTLSLMERYPIAAGVGLGLLGCKPQFGLLFPIALVAGARWRVIAAAAATMMITITLSWLAFGTASWQAFFAWMPTTSHIVLGEGGAGWNRLQSVFGLIRSHGGGETLAMSAQIGFVLALAVALVWLWRSERPFALKAAALATAALLATPYACTYDLVALAIPVAFLVRLGLINGFLPGEGTGLAAGAFLLLVFPYAATQVGLGAGLIVALLIARRAWAMPTDGALKGSAMLGA
jgi:arabinofuranan 3-O-arabinosyltransferase